MGKTVLQVTVASSWDPKDLAKQINTRLKEFAIGGTETLKDIHYSTAISINGVVYSALITYYCITKE